MNARIRVLWADSFLSSLDEELVDVGLEGGVGELIRGANAEELEESGITLDEAALAETLLLDVGAESLGHLRARGAGVLALAKEEAEVIGNTLGGLEGDDDRGAIGVDLAGNLALLLGILDLLGDTLLDALEVGEHALEGGDLGLDSGLESLELLVPGDLRDGRGSLGNGLGSDNRGSGGLLLGNLLLNLRGLGLLVSDSGSLGGSGLLLNGLGGSSGGGGGLGHFARGGGIHLGVFYASLCLWLESSVARNFFAGGRARN